MPRTSPYDPELRAIRWVPRFSYTPLLVRLMSRKQKPIGGGDGVRVDEVAVSATASIRLQRPEGATGPVPVLVWIHGGGHLIGSPEQDARANGDFVRELGIAVAAVRYRLGVKAPAPASLEDCAAALAYLVAHADELGIDPHRIAIGGASAGGGIAAGLTLMTHDRGEIPVAFQLLVYPMLDDRTVVRTGIPSATVRIWTPKSNRYGWETYLGVRPGSPDVSPYAAPARREDLSALPPTWIGVGTEDLFLDEDREYARRLQDAGVPTTLTVVPGAFHGFDALFGKADITRRFWRAQADALRAAGIVSPAVR